MIKVIQLALIFLVFNSAAVMAGTVIEVKDEEGISAILTDGKQVRLNTDGLDYVIIDTLNNTMKSVVTEEQMVILFDMANLPKTGKAQKVHLSIKNLGAGPAIAGYKTQKFGVTANGSNCGVIYGSKQAYRNKHVKVVVDAMRSMAKQAEAMLGGFASMVDDCELADLEMSKHTATIGVPMRSVVNGVVDFEITAINFDVALPADTFVIPASYKITSMAEVMQNMSKDNMQMLQQYEQQMQQYQQEMMRQLPPEAMEQLRRTQ